MIQTLITTLKLLEITIKISDNFSVQELENFIKVHKAFTPLIDDDDYKIKTNAIMRACNLLIDYLKLSKEMVDYQNEVDKQND